MLAGMLSRASLPGMVRGLLATGATVTAAWARSLRKDVLKND